MEMMPFIVCHSHSAELSHVSIEMCVFLVHVTSAEDTSNKSPSAHFNASGHAHHYFRHM